MCLHTKGPTIIKGLMLIKGLTSRNPTLRTIRTKDTNLSIRIKVIHPTFRTKGTSQDRDKCLHLLLS